MVKKDCLYWSVPRVAYRDAWKLQLEQVRRIGAGESGAALLFLEHFPVITIGKGGAREHLLVPEAVLRARGVECIPIDRGGDITFHGPGQLVVYPLLSLTEYGRDVHQYLRRLEEIGIRVLADYGIDGGRVPHYTGVWVGDQKIMAIGVGVKKWVTFHGLAFNFAADLEGFQWIVPCGIKDKGVTSLHRLLERPVSRVEVEAAFVRHFEREFGLALPPPRNPFPAAER